MPHFSYTAQDPSPVNHEQILCERQDAVVEFVWKLCLGLIVALVFLACIAPLYADTITIGPDTITVGGDLIRVNKGKNS